MCKCVNTRNNKHCCCNILIKRWFLPLIAVVLLFFYEEVRNVIYLPLITSFVFFILFWNFPIIVYHTASRPLYYEDLFIDEKKMPNYEVEETIKSKFQCILQWVLIITNTLLVGALSEYWFYKLNKNNSWIEILGVTGGIIKIFQIINNTISRIMLKILKVFIRNENKKMRRLEIEKMRELVKYNFKLTSHDNSGVVIDEKKEENSIEMVVLNDDVKPRRGRLQTI